MRCRSRFLHFARLFLNQICEKQRLSEYLFNRKVVNKSITKAMKVNINLEEEITQFSALLLLKVVVAKVRKVYWANIASDVYFPQKNKTKKKEINRDLVVRVSFLPFNASSSAFWWKKILGNKSSAFFAAAKLGETVIWPQNCCNFTRNKKNEGKANLNALRSICMHL